MSVQNKVIGQKVIQKDKYYKNEHIRYNLL